MTSIAEHIARERGLVGAKQLRYSLDFAQYYHRWYSNVLLGLLPSDRSYTVLDCGCGTGVLLPPLRQRSGKTVGLDLCWENLREARVGHGAGPLVVADVARLPVAPASFNQIVCRGVLHRLADVAPGLRELCAALKPGGDLVISEPIGDSRAVSVLRDAAFAAGMHPFPGQRLRYLTVHEWIAAAHAAGLRTERWFHLGYVAFPLIGFPDAVPLMRHLPGRMAIARLLLHVDRVLARTPGVRTRSWQAVFHFRKPPSQPGTAESSRQREHAPVRAK